MIRFQVSFVLAVRDGFTGKPITQNTVRCRLDGQPFRPEYRRGGYLVFVNIPAGRHDVVLSGAYYQDERLAVETTGQELSVLLKPAAGYPFGRTVTKLTAKPVKKAAKERRYWIAIMDPAWEVKLQQDEVAPGDKTMRLFYRGGAETEAFRFPRNYLFTDEDAAEIVSIHSAEDGQAELTSPIMNRHKRGAALYPAQVFQTDEDGGFLAFFRESGQARMFDEEKNKLTTLKLTEGENTLELKG